MFESEELYIGAGGVPTPGVPTPNISIPDYISPSIFVEDFIDFECTNCKNMLRVGKDVAGKMAQCPVCASQTQVPGSQPANGSFISEEDANRIDYKPTFKQLITDPQRPGKLNSFGWIVAIIIAIIITLPFFMVAIPVLGAIVIGLIFCFIIGPLLGKFFQTPMGVGFLGAAAYDAFKGKSNNPPRSDGK
jgi:hypothetical protein